MSHEKSSINHLVWGFIEKDLCIKKSLGRQVINTRALADYLIDKYSLNASLDSVISAIRRYQENFSHQEKKEKEISNIFKESTIKTRNNVMCLTLKDTAPILEWCGLKDVREKKIRVITGENTTKLILHNSLIKLALDFFSKKDIIKKQENLAEISLEIDSDATQTKGVLARITGEIALRDINIEEAIISEPEFVLYIKNQDLLKAHEALFKLNGKS